MNLLKLPPSELPSPEVLSAGAVNLYSDIFPHLEDPSDATGLLGNYTPLGPITVHSPLWAAIEGVRNYHLFPRRYPVDIGPVDEPPQAKSVELFQMYLVRCVGNGYANLLVAGQSPEVAVTTVAQHVEDRDREASAYYTEELNALTGATAARERETGTMFSGGVLAETRLRLRRLKFEWLSATTIVTLLAAEVSRSSSPESPDEH